MATTEDPWDMHVARFRITSAQIAIIPTTGEISVHHDLDLIVEEGREEALRDDGNHKPTPSALEYFCRLTIADARPFESWSGIDAKIVVSGRHETGCPITLAGDGSIGRDDNGNIEAMFETPPQILVAVHSS